MTQIIALDLSMASSGIAIGDASGPPRTLRASFPQRPRSKALAAYRAFLRGLIVMERPHLVVAEAAWMRTDEKSSAETTRMLLYLAAVTEELCGSRDVDYMDVASGTWRKSFLGHGRPTEPKKAALMMCASLGWPTDGNHDRAEAAGVWAHSHLHHGNAKGVHRMLSVSSLRGMEAE